MAAVLLLFGCDGSGSSGLLETDPGEVRVTTETTGSNVDADGYRVSVSEREEATAIGVDETRVVDGLGSSRPEVELNGIAEHCTVKGQNPRRPTAEADSEAAITFRVRCWADDTVYIDTQADFDQYKDSTFAAGTQILFKEGAIFNGQFRPGGSGTADAPITVAAYDPESGTVYTDWIDNKPIINGQGDVLRTVYLHSVEFWEVRNLEVTNTSGSVQNQGDLRGIHVVAEDMGVAEHIVIEHCYVHDVNGRVAGKQRGGIHFNSDGANTRFDDVQILNNVIENVGGVGIGNQSSESQFNPGDDGYIPWTNMVIRGNRIVNTGRNSIIFRYSDSTIVEHNTSVRSSLYGTGHSIVNFNTKDAVVQYNEAYGNTGRFTDNERGGYDADYNSVGTVIQYNYSHDNHWFCGIMRRGINEDVTIRYNVSQDELVGSYLYGFPSETGLENVKVYNNVHYFSDYIDGRIFVGAGRTRTPIETVFANNIWYFEGEGKIGQEPGNSTVFRENLFYNVEPPGGTYLTDDPLFVNPGAGGTDIDMTAPDRLVGYELRTGSPAIDAGVTVQDNGGQDFWGNPLYNGAPDIGAYEAP
jgi:hypothetical protein